jgi:hypothetical protein
VRAKYRDANSGFAGHCTGADVTCDGRDTQQTDPAGSAVGGGAGAPAGERMPVRKPASADWRTLLAGWELDALVWARVFGRPEWMPSPDWPCGLIPQTWEEDGVPHFSIKPPSYSTDIAAAWKVVHHLQAQRVAFEIESHADWTNVLAWHWGRRTEGRGFGSRDVPLAICRAALAAVEVAHV